MITVREGGWSDLPDIMAIEEEWPEGQRAERAQFESRLSRFPAGFLVAESEGRVLGVSTSCLIRYDPEHPEKCTSWAAVTNDGFLPEPGAIERPNALYIVSTGVTRALRYQGVGNDLIRAQIAVSQRLHLPYAVSGVIIPGYDAYCRAHGDLPASDYVFTRAGGVPVDPFVRNLESLGFVVPDKRHVIASYYPSPESRDYSVFVVHPNTAAAPG